MKCTRPIAIVLDSACFFILCFQELTKELMVVYKMKLL
jgi:hypothetical protein